MESSRKICSSLFGLLAEKQSAAMSDHQIGY